MTVCDRKECTGCSACADRCPKDAINICEAEDTGHYFAVIQEDKCIGCGLCKQVCPNYKNMSYNSVKKTYAAWGRDLNEIDGCSSGGVAHLFYRSAILKGYYVVGALLDENLVNVLKVTNELDDLDKFKSSKYVQANALGVYKACLEKIKEGKKILFIGMPCQCAAIINYIPKQYREQVLVVELICHGAPSPKVFREYLNQISKKTKRKIDKVSFRSSNGIELKIYSDGLLLLDHMGWENDYINAFQKGLIINDACFYCKYAQLDRVSDITIGDFWGIEEIESFDKPKCNVSALMCNTQLGIDFLSGIDELLVVERSYEEVVKGNPNIISPSKKDEFYKLFWDCYHNNGVDIAFNKTYGKKLRMLRFKQKIKKTLKILN